MDSVGLVRQCKIDPSAATNIPAMAPRKIDDMQVANIDWPAELARHDRWLKTIVGARLRDVQEVEDVMQEVALAAVRQAAPLKDASKNGPWLYQLAVRQCLLYRRKRGRQKKLVDGYSHTYQPTEHDQGVADPLSWLLADERRAMVRQAIGRLHRRDAEILLLKYTQDWSYHQIAEHLGVSHSAVEARLHRARGRLRKELTVTNAVEAV